MGQFKKKGVDDADATFNVCQQGAEMQICSHCGRLDAEGGREERKMRNRDAHSVLWADFTAGSEGRRPPSSDEALFLPARRRRGHGRQCTGSREQVGGTEGFRFLED
ncbi:hypothetical protein E2542_SST13624 [Spatholobus suberectus]|nr:hypothetical protein E2542_SST13624 [Spatholobus suberectus]